MTLKPPFPTQELDELAAREASVKRSAFEAEKLRRARQVLDDRRDARGGTPPGGLGRPFNSSRGRGSEREREQGDEPDDRPASPSPQD